MTDTEPVDSPSLASPTATQPAPSLRLFLLGAFRLERNGQPVHLPTRKAESLLAYLALHPEEHAREKIAALFWGDSPDELARRSLRTALSSLRKDLGDEIIAADREIVQLHPSDYIWVDAIEFQTQAAQFLGSDPTAINFDLYRGELLAGFYDDWIGPERESLCALYLDALLRTTQRLREQSEYTRAGALTRKVIAVDAANETAYQQLMFCLWSSGDRSAALKQFDECKRALREELGVDPSPDTLALVERIQRASVVTPSLAAAPTNLPIPLTSFIGREREMSTVKQLLDTTRLLTLTGVGGCGKTRLAIQVARDVLDQFTDGIWWVELAAAREDERVLQLVFKAVGLVESQQLSPLEALLNHLRTKQALLVIDNCEHLVKACAELAETILSQCAQVRILTTSREALSISGEIAWLVPSLSLPASDDLTTPTNLLQSESVRLFVERAKAMRPDFAMTPANAQALARVCRRLDGIPLAIELAAARLKALTVEQIDARLDDRFGLLTTGSRTALPRQQTLRATIDWSYALLTADEQALFRRLGVFTGGCTLHAVQAFLEIDNDLAFTAEDGLSALIDKSLVVRREDGDGQSRYSMLETIREYALEKLKEQDEYDVWMERLARYMVAQDVDEDWNHLTPIGADNWRTAMTWLQDATDDAELRFKLVWLARALVSNPEEALWLERVLAHPQSVTQPTARARALFELGARQRVIGDLKQAHSHLEQCLALCREHNFQSFMDDVFIDSVLEQLGLVAREQDEVESAREYFLEGLTLAQELEHDWTSASIRSNLAEVETMAENALEARRLLAQSLETIRTRVSDHPFHPLLIGWATNHMGHVALLEGHLVEAKAWIAQSIQAFESLGLDRGERRFGHAWDHHCLGEVALSEMEAACANSHFKQAIPLALEFNDNLCISWCLVGLAGVATLNEDPEHGARLWGAGEGLRQRIGCRIAPASRLNRERTVVMLCEQLGEAEFKRLTTEGQAMTLEQAIEEALRV